MKNINKKILLIVSFILTTFLIGCDWDKEVRGPTEWISDKATPIDIDDNSSYNGTYIIDNFSMTPLDNQANVPSFDGGLILLYDKNNNKLTYNYLIQYSGYPNINKGEILRTIIMDNLTDYELKPKDNYVLELKKPLTIIGDGRTYTINSIRKSLDGLVVINNDTKVDEIKRYNLTLCDPLQVGGDNCSSVNGATKYIGSYRIEKITCNNQEYIGGIDFAGEMTATPYIGEGGINDIRVPITVKFQVSNSSPLKNCILNNEQIDNNNFYYASNEYPIESLAGGLNAVFEKVGLIGLKTDNETERTTQIDYEPKNIDYTEMTFNGNTVKMRLKVTGQGTLNIPETVKMLDNKPYFTLN